MCIAINTGIDYRAVRSLDEIHKRVTEFNKLYRGAKKNNRIPQPTPRNSDQGGRERNVIKLPMEAPRRDTESSLIALA
jgi:hypothetical protein